jgi:hypothetical protein
MPVEVNRQPKGLQELLQLNLQGDAPRSIDDRILLNLDLYDFYLTGRGLQTSSSTGVLTAPGAGASIVIPRLETWAVKGLTCEALNNEAAMPSGCSVGFVMTTGPVIVASSYAAPSLQVGASVRAGVVWPKPLILPGDTQLIAYLDNSLSLMAVGFGITLTVAYYKLAYS